MKRESLKHCFKIPAYTTSIFFKAFFFSFFFFVDAYTRCIIIIPGRKKF